MECRPHLKRHFFNILDCFTGVDGGGRFFNLKVMLEILDKRAEEGDEAAAETLETVARFSRLIDTASR